MLGRPQESLVCHHRDLRVWGPPASSPGHLFWSIFLSVPFRRQDEGQRKVPLPGVLGVEHSSPSVMCTAEPAGDFTEQVACFASSQKLVCDTPFAQV